MHIDEAVQTALQHHQKGNFQQAENIYREILKAEPDNFYALHYLGVLYSQKGDFDLAIEYIEKAVQVNSSDSEAYYNLGIIFQGKGKFDEAITAYQKSLQLKPINADAHVNLGIIFKEKGKFYDSIINYRQALLINPNHIAALYNLGYVLQAQEQIDEAVTHYRKALELKPDLIAANYNLGYLLQEEGKIDEAKVCFEKVLQLNPNFTDAYNGLGVVFLDKGYIEMAITNLQKALRLNPNFVDAHYNLGNAFKEQGNIEEAIQCYQKALQLNPFYIDAYNNLGNVFKDQRNYSEAINSYKKALQLSPKYIEAYYNLGLTFKEQNNLNEAIAEYNKAIAIDPHFIRAYWAKCMSQLPVIYSDPHEIQIVRAHYHEELIRLRETISLHTKQDIQAAADAVGSSQPFLLACQGLNDRELQQMYGEMVCNIMASRYPQYAQPPPIPPYSSAEPIRIGIVSKFFYWHSVWKIPIRGWVEHINKEQLQLYGYYTGRKKDHVTEAARKQCYRFVEDVYSFKELCRIIRDDNLHVLIYPEIGMDSMTSRLASLRLAPIQCVSLGHPDTTGLPTIDYYLSSELMEPTDADEHYTEKLIRLPNLGFSYIPFDMPSSEINRETFGLRPDSILYLCSHALFTQLPQYDFIYPRIAQEVNNCQFVFIADFRPLVTEQFRERLRKAFSQYHLNADDYIVILPRLKQEEYCALNCVADVFLDTIGWSANNSTFEALNCNLPIVTLSGKLMRQRHCTGILTMMGMTETIATNVDEYVLLAVNLGRDSEWRQFISDKISKNKHLSCRDRSCIAELEKFLERAVKEVLN